MGGDSLQVFVGKAPAARELILVAVACINPADPHNLCFAFGGAGAEREQDISYYRNKEQGGNPANPQPHKFCRRCLHEDSV